MNSIRARLLVALVTGILPVICASLVFVYFHVSRSLHQQFDASLTGRIDNLVRMAEWWDGEFEEEDEDYEDLGDDTDNLIRFEFAELDLPEFAPSDDPQFYQVWSAEGVVQARSPSLGRNSLPADESAQASSGPVDVVLPNGRAGRIVWRTFVPPVEYDSISDRPDTTYRIAYGRSTETIAGTLGVLRVTLLISGAATLAVAAFLIWFGVKRGLKPLDTITGEIASIGEYDFGRRIQVESAPTELRPVCTRINAMLDRIQLIMERERRFTSDVAHELRTPLAELRTLAEVSGRRADIAEADQRSYQDVGEIAVRLERLINTLLELSRCLSGQVAREIRRADLARLIEASWKPFENAAESKQLHVSFKTGNVGEVDTDPLILGTILSNLFSNAVEYTPDGGDIQLKCETRGDAIALALTNSTNELTKHDLPRLADKFWRKHGPDTRTQGHLGLGLALVDALAPVLDATLECGIPESGYFCVRLVHPN